MTPRRAMALWACAAMAAAAAPAHASFLAGDALDTAADVLAWIVLVLVPVIGIAVFWMVHVLPEKIAHQRHHPQRQAIQTLCLLSLVFGGLLWPIAWLWAYTRPVGYKSAYGTDKHEDYYTERLAEFRAGRLSAHDLAQLDKELAAMDARAALSPEFQALRDEIAAQRRAGVPATKSEAA
ncbi:MAG TPA: DUF3302 domain-containing protein [Quisquiliibacterium sp.]|nr:DUF3302 domain-containing protein [Quisquiliibacterium sp.]